MNERKGDKLMKFGPEWLRKNLSKDNSSNGSNSSSLSAKSRISTKFKPAEHKYKRDDLLSFYRGNEEPPEELKSVKAIFVPKSQIPIGLQFCPRRVRAKRSTPRIEPTPTFDVRPPNRTWSRESPRPPVNYFQPRWLSESWRQNQNQNPTNRGPETEEQWRNSRQEHQNSKLKWNEKFKDRKDFSRSYSNDPWSEDRLSPEDILPEWANSEDLEETGTFDSTGAFLPIVIDKKVTKTEQNVITEPEIVVEKIQTVNIEDEEENAVGHTTDESINIPKPITEDPVITETMDPDSQNRILNAMFDMGNPNLSIEDYLNRLVQEDDIVKNRSKADSNKIGYVPGSNPPNLSQSGFSNTVSSVLLPTNVHENLPPLVSFSDEANSWYYRDRQDNVRGPYSAMDMIEFFNANFFHSYTLMRKGIGPHFETFARLFDLCGGMPFLYSDQVALNSCFAVPYLPVSPNMHKMFQENNPPPSHPSTSNKPSMPVKDFINAASASMMKQYNQHLSDMSKNALPVNVKQNVYIAEPMQFPINHMLQQRPDLPIQQYQQSPMMDPLSFPYNQYPLQPQEHLNAPNIPIQMDKMVHNDWKLPSHGQQNITWTDTSIPPPKVDSYVPIPMPVSSLNAPIPSQEPASISSHSHDDYLSGLPLSNLSINSGKAISPQLSVCNVQTMVSTTVTNSPIWNNQPPMQLKPLNYVSNPVLAHRQKLLYNLPPQQQQFPPVEQPTYVVQEKPLVVHEPENLFNVDFEKFQYGSEAINRNYKEAKSIEKKKATEDKKQKGKEFVLQKPKGETPAKQAEVPQKKQNLPPFTANVPWETKDMDKIQMMSHDKLFDNNFNFMKNVPPPNINTSKLPNQAMFIPNREKQANLPPSQFPWSNTKPLSANVVSLDEIQAEEQFQLSKLEKSASTSRIFHSRNQKMWNNSSENTNFTTEGFWDTQASKPKAAGISKIASHSQLPGFKTQPQNQPKVEKASKIQPKVIKPKPKEVKSFSNEENKKPKADKPVTAKPNDEKLDEAVEKFKAWAKTELACMSHIVDVPAFVNFLHLIESPYELEDYVKFYLKDEKFSMDFSKEFVQRRSKMRFSKSRSIPCDDLCSPAPAYNPSLDKRDDAKNKNKKNKKSKMYRVDSRILGFNATASENRFNVGNIDIP